MVLGKHVLLIVSGGIAAYKSLELVRRLREHGVSVRAVLTRAGAEFVTPLSLSALTEDKVYSDLFSLSDEAEMGHIQLSRGADLLVVAPAMNVRMWQHPATQANLQTLEARGTKMVGPNEGDMACGEYGPGRMAEPHEILAAIESYFGAAAPLSGRRALVTSGPTHEPIDPVRYIANRSSGRQGHAIANALSRLGAETTLVSGPTHLADPAGVRVLHVESAEDMLAACRSALPVDLAVCAAAVADWRVKTASGSKLKKTDSQTPALELTTNPDILAELSQSGNQRPELVIGFAAETERVAEQAAEKRLRKGCDWIVANDVSPGTDTFGGRDNEVQVIDAAGAEAWPRMTKEQIAGRLAERIARHFADRAAGRTSVVAL